MNSFWHTLPKPFFALAPMEDVTDAAFRRMITRHGKPDVLWTEFVSADGLVRADAQGQRRLRNKLLFAPDESPTVVQLFSAHPDYMEEAARIVAGYGFAGIDINMGCPDKAVERQGAGAALMKNPTLAREIIRAAKRGARNTPISVKTRVGYNKDELATWLPLLLEEGVAAVTIHARTRKELSLVPARWEHVAHAVRIRDEMKSDAVIIGNGDVKDLNDAKEKAEVTGCDGVMLGRAVFGNPWLFANAKSPERSRGAGSSPNERISALIEHLTLFDELHTGTTSFAVMKKHFKAYISGWDHAKDLRERLMATENVQEAIAVLSS